MKKQGGKQMSKQRLFKTVVWFFVLQVVFLGVLLAKVGAALAAESVPSKPAEKSKKKVSEMTFDEILVQGQYHFSDESVVTVEDDKVLDALLGVRTEFKDRLKKSATKY